jgi:hypothetical protein
MKKLLYILMIASFASCDYVENPIPEQSAMDWSLYPEDTAVNPYPWPAWTSNTNTQQNILLEDYTGHTCTNCPAAAVIAKQLEDANNGRVIVSSIHASTDGAFQSVLPPEFITDFQTTAGTAYANEMPSFIGNPMGTINRKSGGVLGSTWFFSSSWVNEVNNSLTSSSLKVNLQLQYNYYSQTNGLFIHTETEFMSNQTGDYNLIIYLIRDDVIAPQEMNTGNTEHHYHHHAVLSDNINGTWGTFIKTDALAGDKFYNDFTYQLIDPSLDSTFSADNLSLITYVCERNSYEVLQVIKTELNP